MPARRAALLRATRLGADPCHVRWPHTVADDDAQGWRPAVLYSLRRPGESHPLRIGNRHLLLVGSYEPDGDRLRKALGVPQINEGTRRLYIAYTPERLPPEVQERARAKANAPEANAKKAAAKIGKPVIAKVLAELAKGRSRTNTVEARRKHSATNKRRGIRPTQRTTVDQQRRMPCSACWAIAMWHGQNRANARSGTLSALSSWE